MPYFKVASLSKHMENCISEIIMFYFKQQQFLIVTKWSPSHWPFEQREKQNCSNVNKLNKQEMTLY